LTKERLNHLAQAALSDPANATARGLMGLVAYNGRFQRPEAVADRSGPMPSWPSMTLDDSVPVHRRRAVGDGVWCEERGLGIRLGRTSPP